MITFTVSIGSIVIGILLGMVISFLVFWLVEAETAKTNQWDVGFREGWEKGCEYAEQLAQSKPAVAFVEEGA
jgi:MFS superfamily sulfate permease-like transporter